MRYGTKQAFGDAMLSIGLGLFAACSSSSGNGVSTHNPPVIAAANLNAGTAVIAGANSAKGSVSVISHSLYYSNLGLVTFTEPWGSNEVTVDLGTYDQTNDFGGVNGSMTLLAEAQNYPNVLLDTNGNGGAYAVLTSFSVDPTGGGSTIEYVNVTSSCQSQGMWDCSNNSCTPHAACTVTAGASGFGSRIDWDQHQVPPYGYQTTNSFPRCDSSINGWSNCPSGFGQLVSGHYHAKYLLLSDSGNSVSGRTANLKITLSIKKDTQARDVGSVNGGINLNVILVGDKNVNDSHTAAGARNLNLLFGEVNRLFSSVSGAKIFINQIKTYEWLDANGGSQYSEVTRDQLGNLFQAGSEGVDAVDNGQNINVFIVSDIEYSGASFTILGLSGAILGPPMNGTQSSGLAFSSFNQLATYNPNCSSVNCGRSLLQNDFLEMAATIVHELGHYLGLNHPSEKPDDNDASDPLVQTLDPLNDTPTCAARASSGSYVLDQRACYYTDTSTQAAPLTGSCQSACDTATGSTHYLGASSNSLTIDPWTSYPNADMPGAFCPLVTECQHNHVMWYTSKNRRLTKADGTTCTSSDITNGVPCTWSEDGNLFSGESSAVLQWDYYLR